tara:strand:- start:2181 stop:2702 length:522 start_codon:yes stop_codon:yes gene_type:complete
MPESILDEILRRPSTKKPLLDRLRNDPTEVRKAIELALSDKHPQGWRAAWVLKDIIKDEDARLAPYLDQMIANLPGRKDGHQRELIHLVNKYTLSDEQEGMLFDACLGIWSSIRKSPSVRILAFKKLIAIIRKYPELIHELSHVMDDEYSETLSPAVKRIYFRSQNELLSFKK